MKQGRNEVYWVRNQRLEKDLESQRVGSGSTVFFMESGIRDQISHRFWDQ